MRSAILGTILVVILGMSGAASAETFWTAVGSTCVPGDAYIQADRYAITAGSVSHKGTNTGVITLYCNVDVGSLLAQSLVLGHSPNHIVLTYKDSDGTTTATYVKAELISMARSNGGLTTGIGSVTSNSNAATGDNVLSAAFTHTFDVTNKSYYVRIDMDRASSGQSAIFYSVRLEYE